MKIQPTHDYTGYGWEGEAYQQTKALSTVEIAKKIKKEVGSQYPKVKVSIRTRYGTCTSAIDLKVLDFGFDPLTEQYKTYAQSDKSVSFRAWCNNMGLPDMRYTKEATVILKEIESIGNSYRYMDTDGQIDYFDTNFYFFVSC